MIPVLLSLLGTAQAADLHSGGGTAHTLDEAGGKLTLGVFRPWTIRAGKHTDVITTGLIGTILSPRLDVKHQIRAGEDGAIALVGGINMPTFALRLGRGWIYNESDRIPFALIGKLGVLATADITDNLQITGGLDLRIGIPFGAHDLTPRDFFFVDWALAPLSSAPATGVMKVQLDWSASERVHVSTTLMTQITDDNPEFIGRVFVNWGFTSWAAIGAGVFTNHDSRPNGYQHYWLPVGDFQLRF